MTFIYAERYWVLFGFYAKMHLSSFEQSNCIIIPLITDFVYSALRPAKIASVAIYINLQLFTYTTHKEENPRSHERKSFCSYKVITLITHSCFLLSTRYTCPEKSAFQKREPYRAAAAAAAAALCEKSRSLRHRDYRRAAEVYKVG